MMEIQRHTDQDFPNAPPTEADISQVQGIAVALSVASKNLLLYPEEHAVQEKSLSDLNGRLAAFLNIRDRLRFYVEKDRIVFQGHSLHQGGDRGIDLAGLLFRDGIRWLEFKKGIEEPEIRGVLKILIKYRTLQSDAEGDIVTALWEKNFPHVLYEAADISWDDETIPDFEDLARQNRGQKWEKDHNSLPENTESIAHESVTADLWELTSEEIRTIRKMVFREENWDHTADVLDLLAIILEEQKQKEDLSVILEFVEDEFQITLEQGEFGLAYNLLRRLHQIRDDYKAQKPWTTEQLDTFFETISTSRYLDIFGQADLDLLGDEQIQMIRQLLVLLPPAAIRTLGPMIPDTPSARIRRMLMAVVRSLANRDMGPLEELLESPREEVVRRLVHILPHLKGEDPPRLLLRMVRHSSPVIRKEALRGLIYMDNGSLKALCRLLDDPSEAIRVMVLNHLGRERNREAEALLLSHMSRRRFHQIGQRHILACYEALGRCGSPAAVPFLGRMLLGRWWNDYIRSERLLARRGAALALMALDTGAARAVLNRAARSPFPNIRQAYREAIGRKP